MYINACIYGYIFTHICIYSLITYLYAQNSRQMNGIHYTNAWQINWN